MARSKHFQIEPVQYSMPDGRQEWTIKPIPGDLSFDEGFFCSVRAIQILIAKNQRIIVVGIAGPSGAGKTSLAMRIREVLHGTTILSMDNYLDSTRKVIDDNFDDSRLFDFDLLKKNIKDLRSGIAAETPLYDFRRSGRYAYVKTAPPTSKVLIVEGTYALHEELRPFLDLMISVSGGVHNDLIKRVLRDIHRTGQDPQQAIQQITETVYPMYKAFIEPDLRLAHIRMTNKFNPFSALLRPTYLLKTMHIVDPARVREALPGCTETRERSYDIYLHPPDTTPIACKDWIRVRNVGGVYSVMFSEDIKEGDFIISPRIDFNVSVKILGGLMALGYKIGAIINRSSTTFAARGGGLSVSIEQLEQLGITCTMLRGTDRQSVAELGRRLGLEGSYINKTFIEMYQERFRPAPATPPLPGGSAADPGAATPSMPPAAASPPAPAPAAAAAAAAATGSAAPLVPGVPAAAGGMHARL